MYVERSFVQRPWSSKLNPFKTWQQDLWARVNYSSVTAIKENVNGEILPTIPNKTEQIINPHTSIIIISVHNREKGTWEINLQVLTTAVFSPIFWFLHWNFYDRRMYLYQSHQWTRILCLSATSIQDNRTFKSAVIYHQGRKVL